MLPTCDVKMKKTSPAETLLYFPFFMFFPVFTETTQMKLILGYKTL